MKILVLLLSMLLLFPTWFILAFSSPLRLLGKSRLRPQLSRQQQPLLVQLVYGYSTLIYASSKEEEIARLEEEIRRLREQEPSSSFGEETAATRTAELLLAQEAAEKKKRLNAEVKGKDMLLTEGALIQENLLDNEEESSTAGMLPAILGAVVAVCVLALVSQVPLGQEDFSRYSAPTGPTVSTKIDLGDINPDRPSGL